MSYASSTMVTLAADECVWYSRESCAHMPDAQFFRIYLYTIEIVGIDRAL
jgi:hypothetical protein